MQILRYNTLFVLARSQSAAYSFTYGEYVCNIRIIDRVVDGKAPAKVIALVNKWIDARESELLSMWEKAVKGEKIGTVEPLK